MNRLLAISLASGVVFACSVSPVGTCTATSNNCIAPALCDVTHDPPLCVVPQGACYPGCKTNESCMNAKCVVIAPAVGAITAPTTWSKRSQTVPVTAVIDGTGGPGLASATLQIAGQPDIAGTTSDTGLVRTYAFTVPGVVQTAFTEGPVAFTVIGTDTAGQSTPAAGAGKGQVLIDDVGPTVSGVTINGGVTVPPGIVWFKAAATGTIDAQVGIQDAGSGVDPASLTLVVGATRLDTGTPTCAAGASAQALVCHFAIPLTAVAPGSQRLIQFSVAGADQAGNPVKTNTAAVGIDGKAPTLTFNIVSPTNPPTPLPTGATGFYPAQGAGCNHGTSDASLFCGHDGAHYFRKGETSPVVVIASDAGGVGIAASGITYAILGSANCTDTAPCAVTDAGNGNFSFVPDLSSATFTTTDNGSGTVSITVKAQDLVGNSTSNTFATLGVTRVKWARKLANISGLAGSPVVTPVIGSDRQIILGGNGNTNDSIVSLDSTGSIVGTLGAGQVTTITNNMAFSPTTNRLYVTQDTLTTAYVYDMAHQPSPALSYLCVFGGTPSVTGSPAIVGTDASSERGLIADSKNHLLWGIAKSASASVCDNLTTKSVTVGTTTVGPPTTDGTNVYVPYGGTGIATSTVAAVVAGSPAAALHPNGLNIIGSISSTSGALFFGEVTGHYRSYTKDATTENWSAATSVNASPIVHGGLVFGFGTATDNMLHAFVQSSGSTASPGFTFGSALGNVSAGTIGTVGGTPVIYFADDGKNELAAVSYSSGTPTQLWSFKGTGLTTPGTGGTPGPSVAIASLGTEPTMDSTGTLYFGAGSVVYALLTDSTGPIPPAAGTNWPRVGFDNCNSGNSSYANCQ